jgi:hypothetical protein
LNKKHEEGLKEQGVVVRFEVVELETEGVGDDHYDADEFGEGTD